LPSGLKLVLGGADFPDGIVVLNLTVLRRSYGTLRY